LERGIVRLPSLADVGLTGLGHAAFRFHTPGSGGELELENGTTLCFAGDTSVFGDMQLIGRKYKPHVAILPLAPEPGETITV